MNSASVAISELTPDEAAKAVPALGRLLHACVHDGASIGFIMPHPIEEAEAFWRDRVMPGVSAGTRFLLVARETSGEVAGEIVGTVQLGCDTMPNQPHRADVSKMLVHPSARRRGIARALMTELERLAQSKGRFVLTLDTRTGDMAEPLYASIGYRTAGVIPDYCLDTFKDRLDPTTVMYKRL